MDVGATNPTTTASIVGTRTVPEKSADISADFDTFLSLLTAQLRSQDPLNPVNSTDFIAQLASFSTVEQQTRTNELLSDFFSGFDDTGALSDYVSWIGQEVAAPVSASFDGSTPLDFQVPSFDAQSSATVTIVNDFGSTVADVAVSNTDSTYSWDGRISSGGTAPPGEYSAHITITTPGKDPVTQSVPAYVPVREVRSEAGNPVLVLETGATIPPDSVTAVRSAEM